MVAESLHHTVFVICNHNFVKKEEKEAEWSASLNGTNGDLPSVDSFADPVDVDIMGFLIHQTNDQQININRRRSTTTIKTPLTIFEDFNSINKDNNELRNSKRTKSSAWI